MSYGDSRLVAFLKRQNERLLRWAFDRQAFVTVSALIGVSLAAVAVAYLPRAFLPPLNEGMYMVEFKSPRHVPRRIVGKIAAVAERLMMQVPEVVSVERPTVPSSMSILTASTTRKWTSTSIRPIVPSPPSCRISATISAACPGRPISASDLIGSTS